MGNKTSEDHQSNSRLGALGESLVQTFLLEHCDWCYPCQEGHPSDLLTELGNCKFTVQVKSRRETKEGKYAFATENSRNMSKVYKQYHCDIIAFVFFGKEGHRILFKSNTTSQTYFTYSSKTITPTMELDSFRETLNQLSSVPVINSLLK
tara:strand:+ start:1347 stop:1796 length:450 start_codon:yes stop_codon:yes gene_type:complete